MKSPAVEEHDSAAGEHRPLLAPLPSTSTSRSSGGADSAAAVVVDVPLRERSTAALSSSSSAAAWPRTCRICFESQERPGDGDPGNPLISPCRCSGGSRFVHRRCLAQWRAADTRRDAAFKCEVCLFRYRFARAWWAGALGHPAALWVALALVLSLLVWALGYVPILAAPTAPAGGKAAAGGAADSGGSSSGGGDGGGGSGGGSGGDGDGGGAGGGGGSVVPPQPQPGPPPPPPPGAAAALHILNGIVALGALGLVASVALAVARACGGVAWLALPDPWCPAALCLDCEGGGGLPFVCLEATGAGECGVVLAVLAGLALLAVGVAAAASLAYQLLLLGTRAALDRAQRMVENVGGDGDADGVDGVAGDDAVKGGSGSGSVQFRRLATIAEA